MLLLDGQVHHDTHAVPMGNYVIGVGNYVIATPSELGNYMSADSRGFFPMLSMIGHPSGANPYDGCPSKRARPGDGPSASRLSAVQSSATAPIRTHVDGS